MRAQCSPRRRPTAPLSAIIAATAASVADVQRATGRRRGAESEQLGHLDRGWTSALRARAPGIRSQRANRRWRCGWCPRRTTPADAAIPADQCPRSPLPAPVMGDDVRATAATRRRTRRSARTPPDGLVAAPAQLKRNVAVSVTVRRVAVERQHRGCRWPRPGRSSRTWYSVFVGEGCGRAGRTASGRPSSR